MPGNAASPVKCKWCGNDFVGPLQWSQHPCAIMQVLTGYEDLWKDTPVSIREQLTYLTQAVQTLQANLTALGTKLDTVHADLVAGNINSASIAATLMAVSTNTGDVHNAFRR